MSGGLLTHQGLLFGGVAPPARTLFGVTASAGVGAGATRIHGIGINGGVSVISGPYLTVGAGTLGDIQLGYWTANTLSGGANQAEYSLVNNSGGTLTLAIAGGSVAMPAYSSSTIAAAASDLWRWVLFGNASAGSLTSGQMLTGSFTGTTEHTQIWGCSNTLSFGTASATRHIAPVGYTTYGTTGLADNVMKVSAEGTIRAWSTAPLANTRGTNTTFGLTVNGVVVSTLTVPGGSTATQTATPNVALAVGDTVGVTLTTGTGGGNINPWIAVSIGTPGRATDLYTSWIVAVSMTGGTSYGPVLGVASSAVLTGLPVIPRFAATLRTPQVYIYANTATVSSTFTLLVNGVASSVTITVPAGTTGWITGTGTATITATDTIAWRLVAGVGAGSITPLRVGIQIENLE